MSLILDHINGIPDDNRLENLRIVCPNCAATLDTHCGRKNRLPRERRMLPSVRGGRSFAKYDEPPLLLSACCRTHSKGPREPEPGTPEGRAAAPTSS